jgi:hypothetical protein
LERHGGGTHKEETRMSKRGGWTGVWRAAAWGIAMLGASAATEARVVRIIADSTTSSTTTGYTTVIGRAFGELDPSNPANAIINDLSLGLDDDGKARYVTSFRLAYPTDLARASGLMWHDVPNRGGRVGITSDAVALGDIQLNSGWQGDNAGATAVPGYASNPTPVATGLVNNEWLKLPIARNADGTVVTGRTFGRIVNRSGANSQKLIVQSSAVPYPPDSLDTAQAVLVSRDHESMEGVVTGETVIPSDQWAWASCTTWDARVALADGQLGEICLKNGFNGNKLYQVVYRAKNAYVLGMGFAAFRDMSVFLRTQAADDFGTANPVAGRVNRIIARGVSQSGNYLRGFLHLGFNRDEAGNQVYDGAWPIIAGRRIALNFRWAQPDGVLELYQAGSEGPQWWHKFPDLARGGPPAGILDRCEATATCPKIIEHFGSAEVWALKLTPEWVGTDAHNDIPLPDNVRRYYIASSTHGGSGAGGVGGMNTQPAGTVSCPGNNFGRGVLRVNVMPHAETVNAIRAHFRDWVMNGTLPPPSQYPTLRGAKGDRNLVDANKDAMGFPTIPVSAVDAIAATQWRTTVPESNFINPVLDYDWGPQFNFADASGVPTNIPPPIKQVIHMLVPRTDADGNELGGVPVVLAMAPQGTYLGWNITQDGFHKAQLCDYVGGMIPFAKTKAERLGTGDPRLSLEERYKNHDGYVNAVRAAAAKVVASGFLLQADADAIIAAAQASSVLNP